jgi:hypothetical protein
MYDIEKMLAGVLLCVGPVSSVCDTGPFSTPDRESALRRHCSSADAADGTDDY